VSDTVGVVSLEMLGLWVSLVCLAAMLLASLYFIFYRLLLKFNPLNSRARFTTKLVVVAINSIVSFISFISYVYLLSNSRAFYNIDLILYLSTLFTATFILIFSGINLFYSLFSKHIDELFEKLWNG
jgi:hypothetical protein